MSTIASSSAARDTPGVYVFVRQTLDWGDDRVYDRIIPAFRPKVDAWNDTFTMPYHVFRQRLKSIAQLNLSRVDARTVSTLDDVPDGSIVVPVDDDDWFAPDLGEHIVRACGAGTLGCLWPRALLEYTPPGIAVRRQLARLFGRERYLCKTNNYAVRYEAALAGIAGNHVRASAYFRSHAPDVGRISATLAMQNRSLASQTTLAWRRPTIGRLELLDLFDRHRRLYAAWSPPPQLAWAAPYVAMMDELMGKLRSSKLEVRSQKL